LIVFNGEALVRDFVVTHSEVVVERLTRERYGYHRDGD